MGTFLKWWNDVEAAEKKTLKSRRFSIPILRRRERVLRRGEPPNNSPPARPRPTSGSERRRTDMVGPRRLRRYRNVGRASSREPGAQIGPPESRRGELSRTNGLVDRPYTVRVDLFRKPC